MQYTLLTGATGLVGRYLLRDLLSRDVPLAVVVRPTAKQSVEERIESVMQMWDAQTGRPLPRPVCLAGDVGQPRLGLDHSARRWVARHCPRLLHNAAVLTFHGAGRDSEPWRTNVGGTRNVLELCRSLGIGDLHYVSTAYVCGQRDDLVRESQLDVGQEFRNDYERSKFQAETLVRDADFLRRLTVYRPAVIAGDSQTGYTNQYHGLYVYLRLMALLVPQQQRDADGRRVTPIRLPMTGEERRNIVPVDWTSQVVCRILQDPAAWDETYHLVPDVHLTPRKIIDAAYRYFNSTGVEYVGYREIEPDPDNRFESEFLASIGLYEPYKNTDPAFDTANLKRVAGDIPCPEIDDAMLHRYLEFGERDRWGKRRPAKPSIPFLAAGYFHQLRSSLDSAVGRPRNGAAVREVGIDLLGPGGGPWKVAFHDGRLCDVQPGLPDAKHPRLRLPAEAFAQWAVTADAKDRLGAAVRSSPIGDEILEELAGVLFASSDLGTYG